MCDTLVVAPVASANGLTLFGKNSDRRRNEAQVIERWPGSEHEVDAQIRCTYISIPQARRTYAVLLCRPFWMWGAEIGANEHGVAIGNEAVHARSPAPEQDALLGMDLSRLALERSATAAEAVDVITTLLERHGQGGNGGHLAQSFYNNAFIVADPSDAFVIETVNREWLVERVQDARSISNEYSIGNTAERTSSGMTALLREFGWSEPASPNHAQSIGNPHREHIGHAGARRKRSTALLEACKGNARVADIMRVLRDHGPPPPIRRTWSPETSQCISICMHATVEERQGQTTGSMVSELGRDRCIHWVTGTAAPCISVFKPVLIDVRVPAHGTVPSDQFDPQTLWWRHERMHRAALLNDFGAFVESVHAERDALEAAFRTRMDEAVASGDPRTRETAVVGCWREAQEAEDRWWERLRKTEHSGDTPYRSAWREMGRLAGISE